MEESVEFQLVGTIQVDKDHTWTRPIEGDGTEVIRIKQNLKVAQDRQKIYVDRKRTHKEFKVGDHVYIRVKSQEDLPKNGNLCQASSPLLWTI
jgi:exosome complex RNA-binding protein Rrp4